MILLPFIIYITSITIGLIIIGKLTMDPPEKKDNIIASKDRFI